MRLTRPVLPFRAPTLVCTKQDTAAQTETNRLLHIRGHSHTTCALRDSNLRLHIAEMNAPGLCDMHAAPCRFAAAPSDRRAVRSGCGHRAATLAGQAPLPQVRGDPCGSSRAGRWVAAVQVPRLHDHLQCADRHAVVPAAASPPLACAVRSFAGRAERAQGGGRAVRAPHHGLPLAPSFPAMPC